MIAENPMLPASQAGDLGDHPQLPKELCQLYYRVTGILMTADLESPGLRQVLTVLREDKGLQELLPYFSQFIQREVKANSVCVHDKVRGVFLRPRVCHRDETLVGGSID